MLYKDFHHWVKSHLHAWKITIISLVWFRQSAADTSLALFCAMDEWFRVLHSQSVRSWINYFLLVRCSYDTQNNTWLLEDMVFCSLRAFNSISNSFVTITREISRWTLEEEFHNLQCPCVILCAVNNEAIKVTYLWSLPPRSTRSGVFSATLQHRLQNIP